MGPKIADHGRRTPRALRAASLVALALCALFACAPAPAAAAKKKPKPAPILDRYSLQGGCYALQSSGKTATGAEHVRMQATRLGSYLLYRPDGTYLAAQDDNSVAPAKDASPAADWRVDDASGGAFSLTPASKPGTFLTEDQNGGLTVSGTKTSFTFVSASGCATYPEADLNATGTPAKGKTAYGAVGGFLEGHMHWMNFEFLGGEFQCGKAWDPYGVPYAIPDCSGVEGPQGLGAPVQNTLNYGDPAHPHDTTGWPKLTEWGHSNLTYDGVYWRWVQRVWMSGLKLMVMTVNENRVLCELYPRKHNSCNEMDSARLGFKDVYRVQDYADAQAGGPGKGFFQVVTDPYQARRVINQGKMAVVLEIEVSEPFDCRGWDTSSCDRTTVDREFDEMYKLGVRSSLLLNKFDNPLVGVRFDGGAIGVLINGGNHQSAGSFWSAETCKGPLHDNTIETGAPEGSALFDSLLAQLGVTKGTFPTYPPAPHCNTRGLTDLGRHVVDRMIAQHMIVNPDHMSQRGVDDTLRIAEAHRYSGVISPHGWMDPGNWPRLWKLGGLAFPGHSSAEGYIKDYEKYRPLKTPYKLGWGYGADLGGLSEQPKAPTPGKDSGIQYPFKSYDGRVTLDRERTGERTFDYNKDGVATYGQYPDWLEDIHRHGGPQMSKDMWQAAEAYLEMWERASGIRVRGCRLTRGRVSSSGLGRLRLGDNWEKLLQSAGQPFKRSRAWSYCVRGKANRRAADVAELTKGGRVELVGSTAHDAIADGIPVGASGSFVKAASRSVGHGLFVRRAGRVSFIYAVSGGRVSAVGVATRSLAGSSSRLRAAMRLVAKARASNAKRVFEPNSKASAHLTGRTLAGSSNPRLNQQLALLCGLGQH